MKKTKKIKEIVKLVMLAPTDVIRLELLELLFTTAELSQLSARYDILKGLLKGQETQRELAASLNLSIAKVTRGSHALKNRSGKLMDYLVASLANENV